MQKAHMKCLYNSMNQPNENLIPSYPAWFWGYFLHQPFSEQTTWQIPFPVFQATAKAKTLSGR